MAFSEGWISKGTLARRCGARLSHPKAQQSRACETELHTNSFHFIEHRAQRWTIRFRTFVNFRSNRVSASVQIYHKPKCKMVKVEGKRRVCHHSWQHDATRRRSHTPICWHQRHSSLLTCSMRQGEIPLFRQQLAVESRINFSLSKTNTNAEGDRFQPIRSEIRILRAISDKKAPRQHRRNDPNAMLSRSSLVPIWLSRLLDAEGAARKLRPRSPTRSPLNRDTGFG